MKQPIGVTVDPEYPSAYIRYEDDRHSDGSLDLARDTDGVVREYEVGAFDHDYVGVVIDLAPEERIIGIEIVDVREDEAVELARDYAAAHGLAFPARLEPVVGHSA